MSVTPTDWTRDEWLAYADRLLAGARRWASPTGARITPPGAEGGYGHDVDGLEGFARTFLLAGFRIAGARGEGVDDLVSFYSRGIAAGVDPSNSERWVRMDEHAQAKVEAASIALILDMTRPWIWERLDATTQQRVIDYLAPVIGDDTYPPTNWLWFRVVVQTFLRSVGGPWSAADIAADLALHDSLQRADGWISDGPEQSYDQYVGWALHLYPVLWSRMQGAADLADGRTARDLAALDRYLVDATALIGADGSPLVQGRSLIYRFAAAAPFWAGVLAEVPSTSAGMLRHAAKSIVTHFADHGVPCDDDLLTIGWHREWRRLAQGYSGPGSPYWAVKGLLGIALPADHAVWSTPAEPLPVEQGDVLRTIAAPGWIVSGTSADGIVRVVNHGTDHATPGTLVGDSPIYARLGYSTATAPLHDGRAWREPLEQSAVLVDVTGRATHRAAVELLGVRCDEGVAVAASTSPIHWIDPDVHQVHHGSGITGAVTVAGRMTVCSVVRGPWELRLVRVDELAVPADTVRLRIGGWAPAGGGLVPETSDGGATVRRGTLTSSIAAVGMAASARVETRRDASPLGDVAAVPVIETDVAPGVWRAALVALDGASAASAPLALKLDGIDVAVTWPDAVTTVTRLIDSRPAPDADR
ncbi:DUF2264 domain-containing protein [Microbacterium horticulturae]|uniref:DUF2264 domain-containing protein n=1 Tax=Microbacterium horticulturae TaxID=3028316 RepID=A0ABY8C314_9MICO|nr:DUF2264 domain-containing protein [Microbacterium sp. KACC 23027]WEG09451.1 DUF2264 domain-containing protein [Microbacterium sp. KACC 23027]